MRFCCFSPRREVPVAANSQSARPPSLVFNRSRLLPEVDSETSSLVALGPGTPKAEFAVRSRRFGSVGSRFTSSPAGLSFLCLNSRFKINSGSTEAAFALPLQPITTKLVAQNNKFITGPVGSPDCVSLG